MTGIPSGGAPVPSLPPYDGGFHSLDSNTLYSRFSVIIKISPFQCNKKMIHQYKNLWRLVCEVYNMPGIAETVDKQYIMDSYYVRLHYL